MPTIPADLLTKFSTLTAGRGLSQTQIRQALLEAEGGASRVSRTSADSFTSKVLKSLSGRQTVTGTDLVLAAENAGMSVAKSDRLKRVVANPGIVNDGIARRLLRNSGLSGEMAPELVEQASRTTGRVLGKAGKRGLFGLGAVLGVAGRVAGAEATGLAGDLLQGTPGNAPGGISSAEMQDQPGGIPDSPISTFQQDPIRPDLTLGLTDKQVEKDERIEMRRLARGARRGDYDLSEEVLEEVRAAQGENEVIIDATSETSGSNNILRSIGTLLGRR